MEVKKNFGEIEKINKELDYLNENYVIVGVLSGNEMVEGVKIIDYAIWNEFGTKNIPARPFFRTAINKNRAEINKRMKNDLEKVSTGRMTGKQALDRIGIYFQGKVQDSIRNGNWTPNSEETKRKKKKSTGKSKDPLIDTGSLIKSIKYQIVRR